PKGLDLLRLLVERAPRVVEKHEIFSIVWKDVAVTDNALTRLVTHIRKILEDDPRAPQYIETIATRGYRFIAPVAGHETPVPAPAPALARRTSATREAPTSRLSRSFAFSYAAIGTLVVLSAAALLSSRFTRMSADTESWLTEAGIPDVVKLAALKPEQMTA